MSHTVSKTGVREIYMAERRLVQELSSTSMWVKISSHSLLYGSLRTRDFLSPCPVENVISRKNQLQQLTMAVSIIKRYARVFLLGASGLGVTNWISKIVSREKKHGEFVLETDECITKTKEGGSITSKSIGLSTQ